MKMFVYGTLKKGYWNDHFMVYAEFLGDAEIEGFAIYDLGAFPGIKREDGSVVQGELYEIEEKILRDVDRLEGNGRLYQREVTTAKIQSTGETVEASTYIFLGPVRMKKKLDRVWKGRSGDG